MGKTLSLSFLAVVLLATAIPADESLAQGQPRPSLVRASYFPLQAGNWWLYTKTGVGEPTQWRVEVAKLEATSENRNYLLFGGYFFGVAHLVKVVPPDIVVERNPEPGRDYLWYMLGAPVGMRWELHLAPSPTKAPIPACVDGARLTLAARDEVVRVPAGEFRNVVRVDWRTECVDAGITSEWFAPGIGLIRRVESSIAGPVVSELAEAHVGEPFAPRLPYSTSLSLDRPVYLNNLMPPVDPQALPNVSAAFTVANLTEQPLELAFSGCKSVAVEVRDAAGEGVLRARGDDGGCCTCDNLLPVVLQRSSLTLPVTFKLITESGDPLPDGWYAVVATLETVGEAPRPAATALIQVSSVH